MTTRLFILIPATVLTAFLSLMWINTGEDSPWFFGLCTLAGIYGILRVIVNHCEFKLAGNVLVVESPLKGARSFDLDTMVQWREFEFHIRAQRRRTIVLVFEKGQSIAVDNSDLELEFTELLEYLLQNHAEQKQEPLLKKPSLPF